MSVAVVFRRQLRVLSRSRQLKKTTTFGGVRKRRSKSIRTEAGELGFFQRLRMCSPVRKSRSPGARANTSATALQRVVSPQVMMLQSAELFVTFWRVDEMRILALFRISISRRPWARRGRSMNGRRKLNDL